jgi:two-component system, OmpR family, phosphate regulon sensor histidine kinase PhoR
MPADASPPADPVALLDGLTELLDAVTAEESGLAGLQRIVDLAATAAGAAGAAFSAYTRASGRVVAATSTLSWSLGHPADPADPGLAKLLAGPPAQQAALANLPPGVEEQLRGRGFQRMLVGIATVSGTVNREERAPASPAARTDGRTVVGSLHVFFRDHDGEPTAWQLAATRLLAGAAAHLYRDGAVLPGYPAERALLRSDGEGAELPEREQEQDRDLFIAMTSHELRTPVTVIKGYADTLVGRWDSLGDPERREAMMVVWQRARELARLVDRLLNAASDLAGLGEGAGGVPFDPAPVLRDAAAELTAELRRNLRVKVAEGLPKVCGDRAGLATVVTELVTNACKYSTDWVDVELTAGADEQTVWIRVSDRGLGIRPEHAERAFERFWQLETGDQRRYGGVGLGLYLVRKIVERQNGWVSLRPREGGGTVAEVRLPRADRGPREA